MFKFPFLLAFFCLTLTGRTTGFLVSVAEDQEIDVIPSPHDSHEPAGCQGAPLDRLLQPNQLIVAPMVTQADTFQELTHAKVLTVPVPVYSMKQPARLSQAQLEFQLVLVKELGQASGTGTGIREVPFPMEKSLDSWFPGYYWSPLVMSCADDNWQHVGWKFTSSNQDEANSNTYSHFYALMVNVDQKQKTQALRIGGFKAPGWVMAAVLS